MATSPLLRIVDERNAPASPAGRLSRVLLIGNFPPRRCGIATFTCDVYEALRAARPDLVCEVYAMSDPGGPYLYPEAVVREIRQDRLADYLEAADAINRDPPDIVCVQHEFGIFGGPAGACLLSLLEAIDRPVVTTAHTVLDAPNEDQRRVFDRLIKRSTALVVMAERGRELLREVWRAPAEKILVVPHGAPDRPFTDTAEFKARFGLAGREVLFTFGLISPNKGIEHAIRAMPAIVAARPTVLYLVLGATHPNLIAREGELYRRSLLELADTLGVADHVRLIDAYTDTPELIEYLQAADIYVTPYLNPRQITSGTLSYAAALGKPVISTPYWHAEELLGKGLGRLVPFESSEAIAREAIDLLGHPHKRLELGRRLYEASRETVWSCFGLRMIELFQQAVGETRRAAEPPRPANGQGMAPHLDALRRMTDGCGVLQHAVFQAQDRRHGYCLDDNARALLLMSRLPPDAATGALTPVYAAFLEHAWNADTGHFRNFMSYERRWLEAEGSNDSAGRAIWAAAETAARQGPMRRWAFDLIERALPLVLTIRSLRAEAFMVLGLSALVAANAGDERVSDALLAKAERLANRLDERRAAGLDWFEPILAYDNARLPEALIRAGLALDRSAWVRSGIEALAWLCRRQSGPGGVFLPVATSDLGRPLTAYGLFDQQPLEAAATIDAAAAAWSATGEARWLDEAERAFTWYFGGNVLGAALADEDGGCCDGLTWAGPNENRGAESVLSLQLAAAAMEALTAQKAARVKSARDF